MSWQALASLTLISATTLAGPDAPAASCTRTSPAHTVALVELYTSEGCSSCPPADRWLSGLPGRFTDEQIVPLALHVDYWDYIGWQDPYAQPQFTDRQRRLGRLAGTTTIYTPEVFVATRELRGWHDPSAFARRVGEINRRPARAEIRASMRPSTAGEAEIEVGFVLPPAERARSLRAVVALYEDRLVSEVRRGENRGAILHHDRVVREWMPVALDAGSGTPHLRTTVSLRPGWIAANLGLVAFVEDPRTGEVLQALALPNCLAGGDRAPGRRPPSG